MEEEVGRQEHGQALCIQCTSDLKLKGDEGLRGSYIVTSFTPYFGKDRLLVRGRR